MSRNKINIQLIIEGCKRGNRNSQRILFEQYAGYGMSICLRYAKNREEAEEILNNGFLKTLNKIEQYDTQYPFQVWLRKIMINTAVDYHRANKNQLTFLELQPNNSKSVEDTPMPMLSPNEDVLPILQQLSPAYRMVFNLSVMEGYKHDEIAEMLGISAGASRSNLARAKEKLRAIVQKKDYKKVAIE